MENQMVVSRLRALQAQRKGIESKWGDIDRLIAPFDQGEFARRADAENSKDWSSEEVWDSTAPIGAERLASMFYSGLIAGRWLGLGFRSPKTNKRPAAKTWLEDTADRMYGVIMSSNFPSEFAPTIRNWVNHGNGCMTQELVGKPGKWEGLDFACTPTRELFFEPDWTGRVRVSLKPLEWTATQIVSKFRDPDDETKPHKSIPDQIVTQAASADAAGTKHEVIFAVYPRAKPKMKMSEKARAPLERPIGCKYVLANGAITLGEEGGYYEMPVYVARYSRSATSMWGFGPSLLALPTVKLLNAVLEQWYVSGGKVLDPATLVTERGLLGELNLGPGEVTTVRTLDDIGPYESKARFDVSEVLITNLQNMVRKLYREDDITLRDSPQMSATEATIRDDRLNRLFGPQVKAIHFDLMAPLVQGTFNHMLREGQLEKIPDEVLEENPSIETQFYGQFMRAQRSDEVTAIERLLASVAAGIKMQLPRARHVVKLDEAYREMGVLMSVPAAILRSEDEVNELEQRDQQIAEAAAKAEIAKTAAEADRASAGAAEMKQGMDGGTMSGGGVGGGMM
jgi:hypothetical protein